jgi:hypothetical protein
MYATYNITTNKLKFFPEERLPEDDFKRGRALGFGWWHGSKCFAGIWTPNRVDWIESFGITVEADDSPDDVNARVDRFEGYAEGAEKATNSARERLASANTARRFQHAQDAVTNEMERAAHWQDRIAGAIAHAAYKDKPSVIARRIKGLEKDHRKHTKEIKNATAILNLWTNPEKELTEDRALAILHRVDYMSQVPDPTGESKYGQSPSRLIREGVLSAPEVRDILVPRHERARRYHERWIEHLNQRLEYEKAYLTAVGGAALLEPTPRRKSVAPKDGFSKGDRVSVSFGMRGRIPGTIRTLHAKSARIDLDDETLMTHYPKGYQVGRRFMTKLEEKSNES